jgi:hypothetical protein
MLQQHSANTRLLTQTEATVCTSPSLRLPMGMFSSLCRRFLVLTALHMGVVIFWDIAPCSLLWIDVSEKRIISIFRIMPNDPLNAGFLLRYFVTLKTVVKHYFESSVHTRITLRCIPEGDNIQILTYIHLHVCCEEHGRSVKLSTHLLLVQRPRIVEVYLYSLMRLHSAMLD